MKQVQDASSIRGRFNRASRDIEERFGHRPLWFKLLVFVPVLFAFTAVVVAVVYVVSIGLYAIRDAIMHH